jgi:hypothetical protein
LGIPNNARWEEGFKHLVAFKEKHGHCLVVQGVEFNDYNLGSWVNSQRYNKEQLTPERLDRLNALGFVWDASKKHLS